MNTSVKGLAVLLLALVLTVLWGCGAPKKPVDADTSVQPVQTQEEEETVQSPPVQQDAAQPEEEKAPSAEQEDPAETQPKPVTEPDTPAVTEEETTQPETAGPDSEALYAEILALHEQALVEQWDMGKLIESGMSTDYAYYYDGGREAREVIGYTYRDLDHNGVPELLIGSMDYRDILDAYTIADGQVVHLFSGWDRNSYYLTPDDQILNHGSNGAFSSAVFLRALSGTEMTVITGMIYDYNADPENPWFAVSDDSYDLTKAEPVSEEEFNAFAFGQPKEEIDYTPFLTW